MTTFSIEPPRRELIVHHTFDDVEMDRVVDHSPQRIDGQVVGDVTFGHPGVVGASARLKNSNKDINIDPVSDQLPLDEVHATAWGRSERQVEATALNVFATITINGTQYNLSHNPTEDAREWQYASLDFDGDTARLRYGKRDFLQPEIVDSVEAVGQVDDFELTFYTNGYGWIDDVRIYRTSLSLQEDDALFDLGATRQMVDAVGTAWDNHGLPFFRGQNNEILGSTLAEQKGYVRRQADAILEARHIQHAAGGQLDRIGEVAGIRRNENEGDDHYRARIIATMSAARSRGTFEDLLNTVTTILDTTDQRVTIERQWDSQPTAGIATAEIFIRATDIENIELTTAEFTSILKDTVPAGHDVEVTEQGANPFTVRNDSQANDSSLGLTSDAISTGGGLVSDA